jgi:hypothetical protein
MLGDIGFEQILDPVDRHPPARRALLGGQIPSFEPCGEDLLCRDPRLMEGDAYFRNREPAPPVRYSTTNTLRPAGVIFTPNPGQAASQ